MYWIVGESITKSVVIPFAIAGETTDFYATLVVEEDETLNSSYLFVVRSAQAGWVQLVVGDDTLDIGCMFDSTCFLGTMVGSQSYDFTFRLNLPIEQTGESFITIVLSYDSEDSISDTGCFSDDSTRQLLADDECEAPLFTVTDDRLPIVQVTSSINYPHKTYDRALPGVSLVKGNVVYLDTSTDPPLLKLSRNDASFAEAAALGIIDDESVNYLFREGGAVASDGVSSLYWHGGIVNSSVVNTIHRLDWSDKLWYPLTAGGAARKEHTAIYYGGKLYFWGGVDSGGNYLNTLQSFDLTTETWANLTTGGTARALHSAVLIENVIHFIGGVNESGVVSTVDCYNIGTDAWLQGTNPPGAFSQLDIGISPLRRPYWQVINEVLYYGGNLSGRNRKFYTYTSGVWADLVVIQVPSTFGRWVDPTGPIQPENSLPQYCARLQPFGLTGPAYWVCMDIEDNGSGL